MTTFLSEAAKKLAERWVQALLLPGLLFTSVLVAVWPLSVTQAGLGPSGALWLGRIPTHIRRIADLINSGGGVALGLLVIGAALASVMLGQVALLAAYVIERLWVGVWGPAWMSRWRVDRRRATWDERHDAVTTLLSTVPVDPAALSRARERRNAVALARPQAATWMGDRIAAVEVLVAGAYHLDLRNLWPRLWTVMPDQSRKDIEASSGGFRQAGLVGGWGLLAVLAGCYWWPAVIAGCVLLAVAWGRARTAIDEFAQLVEAAVDVHVIAVAKAIGLTVTGQFTPALGDQVTAILSKT